MSWAVLCGLLSSYIQENPTCRPTPLCAVLSNNCCNLQAFLWVHFVDKLQSKVCLTLFWGACRLEHQCRMEHELLFFFCFSQLERKTAFETAKCMLFCTKQAEYFHPLLELKTVRLICMKLKHFIYCQRVAGPVHVRTYLFRGRVVLCSFSVRSSHQN